MHIHQIRFCPFLALTSEGGEWVIFSAICLVFAFWGWMLVDCAKHERAERKMWILIIVFFSVAGACLYLIARKLQRGTEMELQDEEGQTDQVADDQDSAN